MKEKIGDIIKLFLLVFMMSMGFFATYSILWHVVGFQLTKVSSVCLIVFALLSEFGYLYWVVNT